MPQPPFDPDYATISEWQRERANAQPLQPSVINAHYASSTSLANRSNMSDPLGYLEVVESSFSRPEINKESVYNANVNESMAYSLQDVRSTSAKGFQASARKPDPLAAYRAQTLAGSYHSHSTHDLHSRAVGIRRQASMMNSHQDLVKPAPVPPPRPLIPVKRNASTRSLGQPEPYLQSATASASQASPLVQSLRAGGVVEDGTNESSEDDVGNDNYIILPGSKSSKTAQTKESNNTRQDLQ